MTFSVDASEKQIVYETVHTFIAVQPVSGLPSSKSEFPLLSSRAGLWRGRLLTFAG